MHTIELHPPTIAGQTATFRWTVKPEVKLYHRTEFTLTFPSRIDLSLVPVRLWWDVLILCLHAHWLLLRPCRIHLPLKLSAQEKGFWIQLLQTAADTLESMSVTQSLPARLAIDIVSGDLSVPQTPIAGEGYATAFSSGKDSLLQAALLFELGCNPLLVATTSPLPPLQDHQTKRRREVFEAIIDRRDADFVEVVSDFRSSWNNGFADEIGYATAVNELTDTFLYMSSLLVAGAALGRTRLFLASETELQENEYLDGVIVQHPHFMYSGATQRTLARYLKPYGMRFGSLSWPLYSLQVQQLLWARYPDLSDLQYSCWRVEEGQKTCSRCEQCMRIALTALAAGYDPQRMGINLSRLMAYSPEWTPIAVSARKRTPGQLASGARSRSNVVGAIKRTNTGKVAAIVFRANPLRVFSWRTWRMLAAYGRLRRRVAEQPFPADVGVREAYFAWLDPELRERLVGIFSEHFSTEPAYRHRENLDRSGVLVERAVSRLRSEP